jgi:ABC-type uncharacterized transport system permease subunit
MRASVRLVLLAALALAVLWVCGMPFYFLEVNVLTGAKLGPAVYRIATWGNTLIAASTVLYMANLYFSLETVGKWATRLAAAGASVLVVDIGVHMLGLSRVSTSSEYAYMDIYDVISVLVPMAVIWSLVVEHVNRNRTAGAFVMPVVLCFVGMEMWLLAQQAGNRALLTGGFRDYWGYAYVLVHIIGYGAFIVAGGTGLLYLLRYQLDVHKHPRAARFLPDSWRAQHLMISGICIGVPMFTLALFLAVGWGLGAEMWKTYAWFKSLWIMGVLGFYAVLLYVLFTRSMPGHRMAWWAVVGLGVTLAAFLGTQVLTLGIPATPAGA